MKIYRLGTKDNWQEHKGYSYHSSLKKAQAEKQGLPSDWTTEIEVYDLRLTKKELLNILLYWASHPDNG